VASLNLVSPPQHDLLTHKHLLHNLAFGCARKYSRVARILAPFPPTSMSLDTTSSLFALHPELEGFLLLFLEDHELDQDLKISSYFLKLTF
jgi:hypothetical protein